MARRASLLHILMGTLQQLWFAKLCSKYREFLSWTNIEAYFLKKLLPLLSDAPGGQVIPRNSISGDILGYRLSREARKWQFVGVNLSAYGNEQLYLSYYF